MLALTSRRALRNLNLNLNLNLIPFVERLGRPPTPERTNAPRLTGQQASRAYKPQPTTYSTNPNPINVDTPGLTRPIPAPAP
ncbi:hypothetical protein C8T65DRAFT_28063 [Cerioporus squamosus]|nr:hypothetical protein C8T65DRAFT_28063 [Cerioporus squamosus]